MQKSIDLVFLLFAIPATRKKRQKCRSQIFVFQFNGFRCYFFSSLGARVQSMQIARCRVMRTRSTCTFSPLFPPYTHSRLTHVHLVRLLHARDRVWAHFFESYWNAIKLFRGNLSANLLLRYVTFLFLSPSLHSKWKCYVIWCKCIWLFRYFMHGISTKQPNGYSVEFKRLHFEIIYWEILHI